MFMGHMLIICFIFSVLKLSVLSVHSEEYTHYLYLILSYQWTLEMRQ